jgi:copper chaperone CopZ
LEEKDMPMDDNCHVEPIQKTITDEERHNAKIALLLVWGMGCPNCAARVRNSLLSQNGVVDAYVDHNASIARVAFNPEVASVDILLSAVARAGNDGRHEYGARLLRMEVSL